MLRGGPTEYFESKPKRVVNMDEFGGAIIPRGTSPETVDMLKKAGMQIAEYGDETEKAAARKMFGDYAFQAGGTAVLGGGVALTQSDKALSDDSMLRGLGVNPMGTFGDDVTSRQGESPTQTADRLLVRPDDKITADEFPKLEAAADFLDKYGQTPIGPAFEGISQYLRDFGREDMDAKERAKKAFMAALDVI